MNYRNFLAALVTLLLPSYLIRFKLGIPTTLFEVVIVILFLITFFSSFKETIKKISSINKSILLGIGLVLVGSFLGVFVSQDKMATLGLFKGFIVTPILAALTLVILGKETKPWAKAGLLLSGSLVGLEAIFEWLLNIKTPDGRVLGIYRLDNNASPNYLSLFLTPLAVLSLHNLFVNLHQKNISKIIMYSLVFLLMLGGTIVSGSRAGVAVIVLFGLFELYDSATKIIKNTALVKIFSIVIIALLIVAAAKISLPHLSAKPDSGRVATSNNIRYEIWKTTIKEIIPEHFFLGVGLGNFQKVFGQTTLNRVNYNEFITPLAVTPHNLFLSSWVDTGLVGLVGLILVLIGFFIQVPFKGDLSKLVLAIIAIGMVDTPVFKNDLGSLFWIIILAGSYWQENKKIKEGSI